MKMIIESPNEQIDLELVALGVNLALNNKCAIQMIEYNKKKGLKLLVKRAFKFKDSLVMKMVRNISQHDDVKKYFCVSYLKFLKLFQKLILKTKIKSRNMLVYLVKLFLKKEIRIS